MLPGDFRDHSLGQKAVDLAVQRWGRLDAVIINHGVLEPCARVADADPKEWSNTYEINIISYVSMVRPTKSRYRMCVWADSRARPKPRFPPYARRQAASS